VKVILAILHPNIVSLRYMIPNLVPQQRAMSDIIEK